MVEATTPQQASPEHRAASRRAGVSQSQRKFCVIFFSFLNLT